MKKSFISPKIELKLGKIGKGLFAKELIPSGDLIIDFATGPGKYLTLKEANKLYGSGNDFMIQVGDDKFFVATDEIELEEVDFINHSCDPNCGIKGSLKIIAMKDINLGEEITFDYAMSESSEFDLVCKCDSDICRQVVTGEDWKNRDLQKKYSGFILDYLKDKISESF